MNAINWFEIPATDMDRATAFYGSIFGIEMPKTEMMGTTMAFFPYEDGKVSGALVKGEGYEPNTNGSLVYLNGGEDLNNILSKVEAAGGKVVFPKTQISPESGHFALFLDTEGNKLGLHSQN